MKKAQSIAALDQSTTEGSGGDNQFKQRFFCRGAGSRHRLRHTCPARTFVDDRVAPVHRSMYAVGNSLWRSLRINRVEIEGVQFAFAIRCHVKQQIFQGFQSANAGNAC